MSSAKTLFAPTPLSALSDKERARRQDAVDWAIAAQRRQGYTHDPVIEEACRKFVSGALDRPGFRQALRTSH
ncbi:antitoxin VbhA family protein [Gluconobacter cerinus]|uniref:antitoxin VbhA family protein n=1 Tax=Gluconobacter cerinus TaxID=38307 RepID=UPI0020124CEE|nr:antitoxin VbhA family protein [Gluconobacter cerinus]